MGIGPDPDKRDAMSYYEMNADSPGVKAEIDALLEEGCDTADKLAERLGTSREFATRELAKRGKSG
jgi:hypothetical protein